MHQKVAETMMKVHLNLHAKWGESDLFHHTRGALSAHTKAMNTLCVLSKFFGCRLLKQLHLWVALNWNLAPGLSPPIFQVVIAKGYYVFLLH